MQCAVTRVLPVCENYADHTGTVFMDFILIPVLQFLDRF